MRQPSKREQNRLEKRARILDAALRVFAEHGFSGASMDAIASAAEVTKPTLYQYFDGKDALFQAMLTAQSDLMRAAIAPERDGDMVDQLIAFAWSYADTVMRPEFLSLARLIIGEASRFPEIGRQYQAAGPDLVFGDLTAFMAQQKAAGRLKLDDPELAAEDFWGLILSAPRNRALHDPEAAISPAALHRSVENGLRVFLRAYSADPVADLARTAKLKRR